MGKRKVGALEKLEADLPALQNKIRRDPMSYKSDFERQYEQYRTIYTIFLQNGSTDDNNLMSLREYIDFVAHVAECYPELTASFPEDLISLLDKHHAILEPELREKIVGALVLLRNKDVIDSIRLLNALFPILIKSPSQSLRELVYNKMLMDLRSANTKTKNHRLNKNMQNTLYNLITSDKASPKGVFAVKFTRELWKRQIWTDAKAVEIMKEAALAENEKVIGGGVRFFLGGDKEREELDDESSDDENVDLNAMRHQMGINKKTKKRGKDLKKATATVKRKEKKKNQHNPLNFSAFHLLHDPQGFAETLFSRHLQNPKTKLKDEQKLDVLRLITRLVGLHQLTLINLYSWFQKYLTAKQKDVTTYLACLAQASHNLVPPELLQPLVRKIADEFVSEASRAEVCSAGLNGIREVCTRQPLAMEDTLLQDLVQYRKSKDKGVMMAAKGLLSLYRDVGAELLHKRDRGKKAAMDARAGAQSLPRFGEVNAEEGIAGIELLEEWKEEERRKKREETGVDSEDEEAEAKRIEEEEAEGWKNWDVEDDESDDSGGWIDVPSDGEDLHVSDSDDDKPKKKAKLATESPAPPADVGTPASTTSTEKPRVSKLATTRILTPADLTKLKELQQKAAIEDAMPNKHKSHHSAASTRQPVNGARHADEEITAEAIEGLAMLSHKDTKEEKIAKAKGDREEKHVSSTALRKEKKRAAGKSSTNKEKARQKNFFMTLGKAKKKGKRSLTDVKKAMQGHVERKKRGGKRGNAGN
ncbi:SDA1 domain-containing protein [Microthyrium microscopicum]|uniref:Protein SDA1 n=1 Tax=Microthyrium microscopicum TaxID=703497 RepID=A0A6A6TV46_9PEZI|nr:SDA1 domain-containing protein [Microthyrium microscopicum]